MRIDARWLWRIIACLGVGACALLARLSLEGYFRHRATGDQAGFALGMAFLVFGFVPATSTALVLGTAPGAADAGRVGPGGWLGRLAVSGAQIAGAGFFLGFQASLRGILAGGASGHPEAPANGFWLADGVLIAFAVLLIACAAAVLWPVVSRSWGFSAILVAVGMAALAAVATAVSMSGPATLMVGLPWVAWAFVVGWPVRTRRRSEPGA